MENGLAYMDSTLENLSKGEVNRGDPLLIEKSIRRVAGVDCLDEELFEDNVKRRVNDLVSYANARACMAASCREKGVEPLAIISSKVWGMLCQKSGVVQLGSVADSVVKLNPRKFWDKDLKDKASNLNFLLGMLPGAALGWTVFSFIMWVCAYNGHYPYDAMTYTVSGIFLALLSIVPGLISGAISDDTGMMRRPALALAYRKAMNRKNKPETMRKLLEQDRDYTLRTYGFVLPPAPKDLQKKLLKLRQETLLVASVPEAIHVPQLYGTFKEISGQFWHAHIEERRHLRLLALQNDPIFYLEENGMVAIIAQYGDFPIEKKLIDEVTQSDLLAEKNVSIR